MRLTVRGKIITLIVLITTVCLGAGFTFVVLNDIKTFRYDMVETTLLMARVVGEYSVSDLAFRDRSAAAETLGKLATVTSIEAAVLFDSDGQVLATYGDRIEPESIPQGDWSVHFLSRALLVRQPVVYQDISYGTILLRTSTRGLQRKIVRHALVMGIALVVLVAVGTLSALRLQRIVSGPILQLSETARKISETEDYSIRVSRTGDDEIGQLCDSINDMLDQIHQREEERDRAEHRTREKSQFLAAMSHELRTPLNSIIGFSEVLLAKMKDELPARALRFVNNIKTSGQHLLGIINDILDLSKVESGKLELDLEPVEISHIVEGVTTVMQGAVKQRGVTIDIELADDLPPLLADSVKIKQVLYNLLSNAVKFSPEGSTVRLVARRLAASESPLQEEALALSVSDEGIGVALEQRRRIFEPFTQAESSTARRFGGTGLGLTLVKAMVEMHHGRVLLESNQQSGSTFTVVIPYRTARPGSGGVQANGSHPAGMRVLLVGDRHSMPAALRDELAATDLDVLAAADWCEGADSTCSPHPSLLLVDVGPPACAGWDDLNRLKQHGSLASLPVVLFLADEGSGTTLAVSGGDYFPRHGGLQRLLSRLGQMAPPPGRLRRPDGETHGLLVISDDEELQHDMALRLLRSGFRLDEARTAEQGVARAAARLPAVIVLDLLTEQMGGVETALRLRSQPRTAGIPRFLVGNETLSGEQRQQLARSMARLSRAYASANPVVNLIRDVLARFSHQAS